MSSHALLLMDHGWFACARVTAAEMSTVRSKFARMRDSDLFAAGGHQRRLARAWRRCASHPEAYSRAVSSASVRP